MKPYQGLQRYWEDTKSGIQFSKIDESRVVALEGRYGIHLLEDFRQYLLKCCPQTDYELDMEMIIWWDLDRIKSIPEEYQHEIRNSEIAEAADKCLFFADYSFWCWAWAIDCSDGKNRGRIALIIGDDQFVADSFGEFIESLISEAERSRKEGLISEVAHCRNVEKVGLWKRAVGILIGWFVRHLLKRATRTHSIEEKHTKAPLEPVRRITRSG